MRDIEIIQINISGEDRPGLTTQFTQILSKYETTILDIGQANIHNSLAFGLLIETTTEKSGFIMKDLMFKCSELGLQIRFTPISIEDYNAWVLRQGKNRYIVTVLGREITAEEISAVASIIKEYNLNIDAIKRLSGRVPLESKEQYTKSSIEFSVRGSMNAEQRAAFQHDLMNISGTQMDISFQTDNIYRRSRRLICFDMDSTLIGTEVIDELAKKAGVGDQVAAITESAMRGEIDFRESFTRRVAMLKGLDENVMQDIAEHLPYNEGMERMMSVLKQVGYKTAILSGGFTYFGKYLQRKFGFDFVYANELEIEDGKLTGRYKGEIVDGKRKAELLRFLCSMENIQLEQAVAVGDGANDLPMLNLAGLGIAYHAKPKVKENARQSISTIGLEGILYFLGLKESTIVK